MCYHHDRLEWEALREAAEPTEATDEAEVVDEREPLAPTTDD